MFVSSIVLCVSLITGLVDVQNKPQTQPTISKIKDKVDICGIYESNYGTVCTIKKEKTVYVIQFNNGDAGIGRWNGNKSFVVALGNSKIVACLAIYQINQQDGVFKLEGEFTMLPGNGEWGAETLTKIKDLASNGK